LERGCRVVCVDARAENLKRLAELYPDRETGLAHVERDSLEQFGRFDIVFCYGLIYHSENPIAALRNITACCQDLLLLETVVTDHSGPRALVDEPVATKNQAASGLTRAQPGIHRHGAKPGGFNMFIRRERRQSPDFQVQWHNDSEWRRDNHLLRCVFVASRTAPNNPQLTPLLETAELIGATPDFQPLTAHDGEVWLDVGAHLGEKTLAFAAQNPNARVYAFELNLKTASKLMGRALNYIVLPMAVAGGWERAVHLNCFEAASSLWAFCSGRLAQWAGGEVPQAEATPSCPPSGSYI
jgi:hypothetical protein